MLARRSSCCKTETLKNEVFTSQKNKGLEAGSPAAQPQRRSLTTTGVSRRETTIRVSKASEETASGRRGCPYRSSLSSSVVLMRQSAGS